MSFWAFKSTKNRKNKAQRLQTVLLARKLDFEPKSERGKKVQTREAARSYALNSTEKKL